MKRIAIVINSLSLLIFALLLFTADTRPQKESISSTLELEDVEFRVEKAFPNLTFANPVGLYHSGDESNRLFVVEQEGIIYCFNNSPTVSSVEIFLDISDKVLYGGEQGLLGLAFAPNYSNNGYFYVDYIADTPRRTVLSRFTVMSNNSNQANITSEHILLEVNQPYSNHNGGQLEFGSDGYLYLALGDGGSGGDPLRNGQNRSTLLGSILRLNVDNTSTYSIPSDNPFAGNSKNYREEIFAYGLRNPWRFSFDPVTGLLWAADVGQNKIEEIDIIESGNNYGWNIMEGSLCYSPSTGCDETGLTLPVFEYGHDVGISITGGYVYRGTKLTSLYGYYIYGDYGSGRIWALFYNESITQNYLLVDTPLNIVSFGVDQKNELYICAFDGKIHNLIEVILTTTSITTTTATTNTSASPTTETSTTSLTTTNTSTSNTLLTSTITLTSVNTTTISPTTSQTTIPPTSKTSIPSTNSTFQSSTTQTSISTFTPGFLLLVPMSTLIIILLRRTGKITGKK
ncbi:MAG: PQQ-dependent sugar dehydrogenase [Candidatus Heimdallarchaeota archaeon]|nr:MAG: PQQ-dependent sugar dehydrogenase [Candidatus Heimdallarchaeota archaeon]